MQAQQLQTSGELAVNRDSKWNSPLSFGDSVS